MRKFLSLFVLVSFVAFGFAACKPNKSGQMSQWENNKKEVAEASAAHPVFKPLLEKKLADSQKMWDEALKITNEDEAAKKMKETNDFLNDLLNQFTQIKYKSKGIEDSIAKFNAKKLTKSEDAVRTKAVAAAYQAINGVNKILADSKAKTEEEAKTVTKEAISKLISAQGDIDRAIKSTEPAPAPKKKK